MTGVSQITDYQPTRKRLVKETHNIQDGEMYTYTHNEHAKRERKVILSRINKILNKK
jgi:hypothetical protein